MVLSEHHSPRTTASSSLETLIFVDVDGVLNVGIKDENPNVPAISFSVSNLAGCMRLLQNSSGKIAAEDAAIVDSILSVAAFSMEHLGEEFATYQELLGDNPNALGGLDVIPIFVQRLARLIQAAGPRRHVVLSSTWRRPQHAKRLQQLEEAIATMLGEPFTFDGRTSLKEHRTAEGRLNGIRAYIKDYVAAFQNVAGPLRVLVLDDFHNMPLKGWRCDGSMISSVRDVEARLESSTPAYLSGAAKLIHTYTEWRADSGRFIQLGTGLSMNHFRDGLEFLLCSAHQLPLPWPRRLGLVDLDEEAAFDSCSDSCDAD